MAGPLIVGGLKTKRAELAGSIEAAERTIAAQRKQLDALDATILLFDPDAEPRRIPAKVPRPEADWAARGGMSRLVLDILREASEPLTVREIALAFMERRVMDAANARAVATMTKRAGQALRRQREVGTVRSEAGPGTCSLWTLA